MSKQVMQAALDAVTCTDQMPYETWMRMHGEPVAAELRAEIAKPVEPVAWLYFHNRGEIPLDVQLEEPDCIKSFDTDVTWKKPLFTAQPDTEAMRRDAELGRVAMRFVDRAGDVHPGIDDAETICADFYKAMCAAIAQGGLE